jgi:diguanylate cyclase (GGDEF)-like protein
MKLRNKITLILVILWGVIVFATFLGSQFVIKNSYLSLETKEVEDNLKRVNQAISQVTAQVSALTANWGAWSDTYKFIKDLNQGYINANLTLGSFASAEVNMILYLNTYGKPVYMMAVNPARTKEVALPAGLFEYLEPRGKLVYQPNPQSSLQGLISVSTGIMLVASHSIVTSDFKGPVLGTLIMGQYLSEHVIDKVKKITNLNIAIKQLDMIGDDKEFKKAYAGLLEEQFVLDRRDDETVVGYEFLRDVNDKPIAIMKSMMPRNVYHLGLDTIRYYNALILIYSIVVVVLLWYLLQYLLVKRLEKLKGEMNNVDASANFFSKLIDGVSDEVSSVASLYHQATHDALTGLANRNLLDQVFSKHLSNIDTHNKKIALLFLDIDHFKLVNDTLGHDVGDQLLISVSEKLNSILREDDLAVRLGGDEFIVMLVGVSAEDIKVVIDRIYKSLSLAEFIKDHELYVTASMGVSVYPEDGHDISTLLKNADIALYHAKETGRNHCQFYSTELSKAIKEFYKNEAELQRALDNKELCLHYQPIYDAYTKRIVSLEALVRWQHPVRGLLNAGDIIPLAEKSGLILPVGKWVLATACQQAKQWYDRGILFAPISVNISVLQTKNTSISKLVNSVLAHTGLHPSLLELELTETSYVDITESILSELRSLRDQGIELAVDDFGVGYSGLGYLRSLPVSKLKIDRSFISNICHDPDDSAITLAIIAIAHQLNLQVIAEGVETLEQYEFLKMNHVDAVQGNYLSEPMDVAACESLLSDPKKIRV